MDVALKNNIIFIDNKQFGKILPSTLKGYRLILLHDGAQEHTRIFSTHQEAVKFAAQIARGVI